MSLLRWWSLDVQVSFKWDFVLLQTRGRTIAGFDKGLRQQLGREVDADCDHHQAYRKHHHVAVAPCPFSVLPCQPHHGPASCAYGRRGEQSDPSVTGGNKTYVQDSHACFHSVQSTIPKHRHFSSVPCPSQSVMKPASPPHGTRCGEGMAPVICHLDGSRTPM